jgi:hypothetical protein
MDLYDYQVLAAFYIPLLAALNNNLESFVTTPQLPTILILSYVVA